MNGKKLIGMALVFVLLAGVAIWQKKSGTQARSTPSGKTLLDGIDLNAVTGLDVGMGSNSVALAKTDGRWRVASLYGYPADFLQTYQRKIKELTAADLLAAAQRHIDPDRIATMVVGNRADFDAPLETLGPVTEIDITIPPPPATFEPPVARTATIITMFAKPPRRSRPSAMSN